jgi:hypothetical protein
MPAGSGELDGQGMEGVGGEGGGEEGWGLYLSMFGEWGGEGRGDRRR